MNEADRIDRLIKLMEEANKKLDRIVRFVEERDNPELIENERTTAFAINVAADIFVDTIDIERKRKIIEALNGKP